MVREPHRRRSPESTRRRRRDRRDSREQLYNQNHIPVSIPYHELEPRSEPIDSRALTRALSSSASSSSSTSSSLVNVSRREGGTFGFRAFFSGTGERKHRRRVKKKSGFLRFGNSSSSSVGSDLAYGRGYVDRQRRRSRGSRESTPPRDRAPRKNAGALERPPAHGRKGTDDEILELGKKFAEMARQQNLEGLKAA